MKDAQKPDHISLNTLISRLKEGRFVIPDFQREFEWRPWDIRELMRSIFFDYYIGSLLLWKGTKKNFDALSCESIYGYDGTGNREYIVLDGQQRLTAMYYAFLARTRHFLTAQIASCTSSASISLWTEKYDEAFDYEWLTNRWSKLLENRDAQFAEHIFPLSVIGAGGWEFPNWVQGYEQYWKDKAAKAKENGDGNEEKSAEQHASNAREFGEHLKGITEQYQISYIELDRDLEVDKVCDIFTQINSRGIRLDVFDLINALLKPKGFQLKHMWRDASSRFEFVETEKMNVYILQVMSILRQSYCSPKYLYFLLPGQEKQVRDPDGTRRKEVLVPDIADFKKRWNTAVNALDNAIKVLRHPQEFGASVHRVICPMFQSCRSFRRLRAHVKTISASSQLDAQTQDSPLVLGIGIQQPIFRLGRINQCARLPRYKGLDRRRRRRTRINCRVCKSFQQSRPSQGNEERYVSLQWHI